VAINTLALLRTAAKQEADKENDPHIGDPEWNRRVNEGYRSLYNLVRSENEEFFVSKTTATCVSAANNVLSVALSGQRLRQLWYVTGSTPDDYERVRRWNMEELPTTRSYKIMGSGVIYIYPASMAPGTYTLWRETALLELVADGDTIDGTLIDWAEYIYLYAALGGKGKEESDASLLGQRLARLEKEILAIVHDLDASEPSRVVDVWPRREYRNPPLPRP
jgi:hypothetical protein